MTPFFLQKIGTWILYIIKKAKEEFLQVEGRQIGIYIFIIIYIY